jgi:L-seryl-tRNA(Ser) seleniumtransferase
MSNVLRSIPSVSELLENPQLKSLVDRVSHNVVVGQVRGFLDQLRQRVQSTVSDLPLPTSAELAEQIAAWIHQAERPALRPVINATGVLLHTGLGRAPLAPQAIEAVRQIAAGYASVEVDLATGQRSQRTAAVAKKLCRLTGAEAAVVVNNNAAATMLALASTAAGKEVLVARGQLVEIGGSYRLPDVMAVSGAILREVGTTNKTRKSDYASAVSPQTGAILRVHTSNYKVVGFTEETSLAELVALGRERSLPVIDDIGSGALVDFSKFGVTGEPVVGQSLRAGADLVLFSGDKLLGGPQCGIIVGKAALVEKILQHPLARAVRVDKMTLAALSATLDLHADPAQAEQHLPLFMFLSTPLENLRHRAERLSPQLAACPAIASAEPLAEQAYLGGGSLPSQQIPTWCVALTPAKRSVDDLAAALRTGTPAVMGRIREGKLLLDLRAVPPSADQELVTAVSAIDKAPPPLPDPVAPETPAAPPNPPEE